MLAGMKWRWFVSSHDTAVEEEEGGVDGAGENVLKSQVEGANQKDGGTLARC